MSPQAVSRAPQIAVLAVVGALCAAPAVAAAQGRPVGLRGVITASDTEKPLAGVDILLDERLIATTDEGGAFSVAGLEPGWHILLIRSIGFEPAETYVEFSRGKTYQLDLALDPRAIMLPALNIEALRLPTPRLREIYERMEIGAGAYITHETLEEWGVTETSLALVRTGRVRLNFVSPGECLEGAGGTSDVTSQDRNQGRNPVSRNNPNQTSTTLNRAGTIPCQYLEARPTVQVLMGRGMRRCIPMIYLDGVRWQLYADQIDDIADPEEIELIEVYDEYEVPGAFGQGDLNCGVIAIWTRGGVG